MFHCIQIQIFQYQFIYRRQRILLYHGICKCIVYILHTFRGGYRIFLGWAKLLIRLFFLIFKGKVAFQWLFRFLLNMLKRKKLEDVIHFSLKIRPPWKNSKKIWTLEIQNFLSIFRRSSLKLQPQGWEI